MTEQSIKSTALPPIPSPNPFTPAQWRLLIAIADTIIAPVEAKRITSKNDADTFALTKHRLQNYADDQTVTSYLGESASTVPGFEGALLRFLGIHVAISLRNDLATFLNILNTRPGCLVLTGSTTPFPLQSLPTRESILQGWATARLPVLRLVHRQLTTLVNSAWAKTSPTVGLILGFPRAPVNHRQGQGFAFDFLQVPPDDQPEIIDTDVIIVGSGCGAGVCAKKMAEAGFRTLVVDRSHYWPPEYLPMNELEGQEHLFMSGGAVVSDDSSVAIFAGNTWGGGGTINWSASLQTPGYVREEWASRGIPFFTSPEYQDCLDHICNRMDVSTDHIRHNKSNAALLEGARRLGYNAKLIPQNTGGNEHYCGYCTYGCGACEKQGPAVSFLPDAARAGATFIEGLDVQEVIFEKTRTKGGRIGRKAVGVRGTWTSRDAHGGVADRPSRTSRSVIIRSKAVIVSAGSLQSPLLLLRSGIRNRNVGRNLHLHPVAILGATYDEEVRPWEGGIMTTLVNEFENLDGHGHGVKLESCVMLPATWLAMLPWGKALGANTATNALYDEDNIKNNSNTKSILKGSAAYKLAAARMRHTVSYIALTRDRDSGQVYSDPAAKDKYKSTSSDPPRLKYTPSAFDRRHTLEGIIALAKIQFAAGAREIFLTVPGAPEPFVRKGRINNTSRRSSTENSNNTNTATINNNSNSNNSSSSTKTTTTTTTDANDTSDSEIQIEEEEEDRIAFTNFLTSLRSFGLPSPNTGFVSAHQMSSCRMSSSPADGVVDAAGKVWGVDGAGEAVRSANTRQGNKDDGGSIGSLYVADASILPSATGVNPMISTMGTAEGVARGIVRDLRYMMANGMERARL